MDNHLQDTRVAIVTGAAQGIGLACAEALLRSGDIVVGADKVTHSTLEDTPGYYHRVCDMSEPDQIFDLVSRVDTDFGRLDVLVNNVGTHPSVRRIDAISVDDFLRLINLNLLSAFTSTKASMPMLRQSRGAIVNIGSLVGLVGQDGSVDYCATKGAISAMTKAIAIDEAPFGVRANNVCPGVVHTPLAELVHSRDQLDTLAAWSWAERMGAPNEIGEVVAFLASSAASFITGQDIVVAGGADLGYGLKGKRYYSAMNEV